MRSHQKAVPYLKMSDVSPPEEHERRWYYALETLALLPLLCEEVLQFILWAVESGTLQWSGVKEGGMEGLWKEGWRDYGRKERLCTQK